MKTRSLVSIFSILLVIIVTLATARPAYADTHYQYTIPQVTWTWFGADNPCGFDIIINHQGYSRVNIWFDGDFVPKQFYINGAVKTVLEGPKGTMLDLHGAGPVHFTAVKTTDTIIVTERDLGSNNIITLPGYGRILGGGGQIVYTWTYGLDGSFQGWSQDKQVGNIIGDWGVVCTYLGS